MPLRRRASAKASAEAQTMEFSALHPTTIAVETTATLLVYAHLPEDLAHIQDDAG